MYSVSGQETARLLFQKLSHDDFHSWLPFFEDPSSFKHWNQKMNSPEVECEKWYENQFKRINEGRGGMNTLVERGTNTFIG